MIELNGFMIIYECPTCHKEYEYLEDCRECIKSHRKLR